MLHIMLVCARTGSFVSTGIETDFDTFDALPEVLSETCCPACGSTHYWLKSETWVCDAAHQRAVLPGGLVARR